eukprot:CAMPEP_0117449676 /NCGR_PEP_ID=MMETSP0759-20121206/8067_1 /TAXON_ID=63605 /ORGANISM="Percolomonas cosmopolitus, Strain WS" /LENGTH=1181 /DNA_ID=CAMNT_0005242157 /DNA_START=616 /DNA_END=4158 /DNA_ORIENTATION=+
MPSRKTYYESIREGQPVSQSLSVPGKKGGSSRRHQPAHGDDVGKSGRSSPSVNTSASSSSEYTSYPEFYFRERFEELDWKTLLKVDIDTLISNNDLDTLEQITKNITFGSVTKRDLKFVSEQDCLHVFQLSQLIIEYLLYVQQYLVERRQAHDANTNKLLNDMHTLKLNANKRKQQIAYLKKDIRRQKRTIFAYQLVFGANPERAKILLQTMRDGNMDIPSSSNTTAHNTQNNPLIQKLNMQLDQLTKDNDFLKAQLNQILANPAHASTSTPAPSQIIEDRLTQIQNMHNQRTQQLQGQISSVAKQISNMSPAQASAQNDLKLMEFVETKLSELLPTLVTEKEKKDVLRLSSSVREIRDRLSDTYSSNEGSTVEPQEEQPVSSDQNTMYKSIESLPAKSAPPPSAPLEQSLRNTLDSTLRKSLKNSIRKPVPPPVQERPKKSTPSVNAPSNIQQKHLFTKIKKEMDLPVTVAIHNDSIPHKVAGTNNVRSKFIHKPEDFDLQKEIVRTDFENYLNKRKLNMSRMDDDHFKKEMQAVKRNRETVDPELDRVLDGVRDIVDGIVMSHNPQWAKFFDKPQQTRLQRTSADRLVEKQKRSTKKSSHIAKSMHKLSTSVGRSLSPDLKPADTLVALQESSKVDMRRRKEEPDTQDSAVITSPVISKPPLDPNIQLRPERRSKEKTRTSKSRIRNSVSTSFSRTSADTFVSSTYSNGTFASSDYSSDNSDPDTQYEEEPRNPPSDRKPRTENNAPAAIRDRDAPSAPLKETAQPEKRPAPPKVKVNVVEQRKQVVQQMSKPPQGRKAEVSKTITETKVKATSQTTGDTVIPVENLASEATITPRSTRGKVQTPTQIMNISATSITQSETSDRPSPREEQTEPRVKSLNVIKNQLARNSPTILHRKSTDSAFTEEIGLESFGENTPRPEEKRDHDGAHHDNDSDTNSKISHKSNQEWHKEKESDIENVLQQLHGQKHPDDQVNQALRDRDAGKDFESEFDEDEPVIQVISKKVETVRADTIKKEGQAENSSKPTIQNPFSGGIRNPFSGATQGGVGGGKFLPSSSFPLSSSFSSKEWRSSKREEDDKQAKEEKLNLSDVLDKHIEDLEQAEVEGSLDEHEPVVEEVKVSEDDLEREMEELDNPVSMDLKSDMNISRVEEEDLDDELERLQDFDDDELSGNMQGRVNKQ